MQGGESGIPANRPPVFILYMFFEIRELSQVNMKNKDIPRLGREVLLSYPEVQSQLKFLQGKILTVVDASYTNDIQRKAVKDLINKMISEQMTWVSQICYPELPIRSREQLAESGVDVVKVEKEAELVS